MRKFDKYNWEELEDMHHLLDEVFKTKYYKLIDDEMIKNLSKVDEELYKACFMFSDWDGLYKAK